MKRKPKTGRPKGEDKKPVNIFMTVKRAERLRQEAKNRKQTISVVVEDSLEKCGI